MTQLVYRRSNVDGCLLIAWWEYIVTITWHAFRVTFIQFLSLKILVDKCINIVLFYVCLAGALSLSALSASRHNPFFFLLTAELMNLENRESIPVSNETKCRLSKHSPYHSRRVRDSTIKRWCLCSRPTIVVYSEIYNLALFQKGYIKKFHHVKSHGRSIAILYCKEVVRKPTGHDTTQSHKERVYDYVSTVVPVHGLWFYDYPLLPTPSVNWRSNLPCSLVNCYIAYIQLNCINDQFSSLPDSLSLTELQPHQILVFTRKNVTAWTFEAWAQGQKCHYWGFVNSYNFLKAFTKVTIEPTEIKNIL